MKKFFILLALLVAFATTAQAQTTMTEQAIKLCKKYKPCENAIKTGRLRVEAWLACDRAKKKPVTPDSLRDADWVACEQGMLAYAKLANIEVDGTDRYVHQLHDIWR